MQWFIDNRPDFRESLQKFHYFLRGSFKVPFPTTAGPMMHLGDDPIWPNRDRFVLSNGQASMLRWSVLHLTGTRAVNAEYERLGQPAVHAMAAIVT
jgi:hypothetical protein